MARRADHSREELRELTLQAAEKIVAKEGIGALTARGLATVIGYSPGTLYNLFDDISALVLHLNSRTLDGLSAGFAAADLTGDPDADLKALLAIYLDYVETNQRLWAALFEHRMADDRPLPEWYRASIAGVLAHIERGLAPLVGPERTHDAAIAARILWASLHGICELSASGKLRAVGDLDLHAMAERLVATFIAGLRQGSRRET